MSAYDVTLYPGLADNCWDLFKLGIRPNGKDCVDFINMNGDETYNCCLQSINPEGSDKVLNGQVKSYTAHVLASFINY